MRLVRTSLVLAVAIGLLCVAGNITRLAEAKDRTSLLAPQANSPTPTLKVYSRETIVDVTVTDAKGNPVHGLTKDDFTVKEDGKPQPIKSFAEFGTQPVQPPPKLPPNIYTNLQPPAPSGAVNILLLDFLNAAPIDDDPENIHLAARAQRLVKQEAIKYLSSRPRGTLVAVVGLSKDLRILQGFTSDSALLRASVDTMEYNLDGRGGAYQQELNCAQAELRNRMTIEALDQIAADTSVVKGRKNLIWFSVGVPSLVNPSARPPCLPDYQSDLLKTYGLLMAAQVTLYPVDARGVPPIPSYIPVAGIPGFEQQVGTEQLAMESWAEATGGFAFYNSNDLAGQISKAIDKGANYYTISYIPPGQKYDYGHHTIKVSINKSDLHLVYRESYDAVDPATIKPAPDLTLAATAPEVKAGDMRAAMGRAMPTSSDILFDVQVKPSDEPAKPSDPPIFGVLDVKLKGKHLTRYGFQYVLPGRQIAFTDGPNGTRKGTLEFDIAAYDADGKLVNSLSQSIQLPLTADQAQQLAKGPFRFYQQLDLPPGQFFVRIGVLDRTSNKVGTLEIPVTVPKNPPQRAASQPAPAQPAALPTQPRNP